ncbi:MAG: hypothetical protein ACRDJO_08265 [Actinomycetota bacterium]
MTTRTITAERPSADLQARRPQFRLRGRAHKLALTAHILTSGGWFGLAVAVAVAAVAAAFVDTSLSEALYRLVAASPRVTICAGLGSIVTGLLLGLGTRFGLVRYRWVVAKIGIAVAVVVTDARVVRELAQGALAGGVVQRPLFGPTIAHVVMLGVATVLSVYRPRARTPWGRRSS